MRRHLASAAPLSLLLLATALPAQAPMKGSGAALKLSTSSTEAQAAFYAGVDAAENVHFAAAATHLKRALELDPKLALARAYYAVFAPALTADQRRQEAQQAAVDAMNASVGELLLVLALRAPAGPERRSLLKAALDAVPDDPHVIYQHASNVPDPAERARSFENLTTRFPEFAPAYNLLAYTQARELRDSNAGLTSAQRYMSLAPQDPNPHDTYAELLQWAGRLDEAAQHYQQALALDATYSAGHTGLAEVALLKRNGAEARQHYQNALPMAATPQARLNLQAAMAVSLVVDGKVKPALTELTTIATDAESQGYAALAAQSHRTIALIEAAAGNRTKVDAHIRKAESLSKATANPQRGMIAAAYAVAGDVPGARPYAKEFDEAAEAGSSLVGKRQASALQALLHAASGDLSAATTAADAGGIHSAFARVLIAEAMKREGKRAEARAVAAEVLANTETDLLSVLARLRAAKI